MVSAAGVTEVERSTAITHLSRAHRDRASDAAMHRVADVVGRYAVRVRDLGVERVSTIATSASRDAENGAEFRALLVARGVVPEIIRGDLEAQLAFAGAASDSDPTDGLLVVDLGGGSTELILGDIGDDNGIRVSEIIRARSLDVGSKRVTELFCVPDRQGPLSWLRLANGRTRSCGRSSMASRAAFEDDCGRGDDEPLGDSWGWQTSIGVFWFAPHRIGLADLTRCLPRCRSRLASGRGAALIAPR
jgi:hypothetical protein